MNERMGRMIAQWEECTCWTCRAQRVLIEMGDCEADQVMNLAARLLFMTGAGTPEIVMEQAVPKMLTDLSKMLGIPIRSEIHQEDVPPSDDKEQLH